MGRGTLRRLGGTRLSLSGKWEHIPGVDAWSPRVRERSPSGARARGRLRAAWASLLSVSGL